jgi:hypothetical protein
MREKGFLDTLKTDLLMKRRSAEFLPLPETCRGLNAVYIIEEMGYENGMGG